ncbi:Ankyrin-3 like protein [Argiope bruennichi]|uniref:Alpha-latrotoxin n=3 Tax=Argiope bruennichi TaxID=94029 RepID=A0A8T0EC36_ARGBR|nr:Ankyrin-3 like protein [Argiope bruennichi]
MGGVLSVVSYFSIRARRYLFGYTQESFTFASKSKAQLVLEYSDLDSVSAKYFYIQLVSEIKNAVLSDDVDRFKISSSLLNYIISSKDSEVIQKYEEAAFETLSKINLVTFACKNAAVKILECLLTDKNLNLVLPFRTDRNDLSPDEDDECHNAFYYAIRSNKSNLLEILIERWPNSYLKDFEKLDEILSKAFRELLIRNVPINIDMELYVKKKLVDLRFFDNSSPQKCPPSNPKDLLMLRIDFVLEKIAFVVKNYCDEDNELDEQFLLAAKYIAQNIHTMKSQLNFTYDKLPWEEMEFSLIIFIHFCLKGIHFEPLYYFILNRKRLLSHLEKFSMRLQCVKEDLKTTDITKVSSKKITRKEVIAKEENKLFEDLYNDFTHIRDIYTLEKMKKYTDIALSADPRSKEGQILITRTLQVAGEHFNNTLFSPKLSDTAADFLLSVLPTNLAEVITSLRNSLSHLEAFCLRCEIEENANAFFANIQTDISKISSTISDILYRTKVSFITTLLKEMTNRESISGKKMFFEQNDISVASVTKVLEEAKHSNLGEIGQLEKLVINLEREFDKEINYSKQMFHRLHDIIEDRPSVILQQTEDVAIKLRDSLLSSDTKEIIKFVEHVLLNAGSPSLLTENEYFVADGKIDTDKVTEIIENIFVKVNLRENREMLNLIKERDTNDFFPQGDELLQRLPDETDMAEYCNPEDIKMVKKLVSDVAALTKSKLWREKERFRRILSKITEKRMKFKNIHEELSETLKCSFEIVHTAEKFYSSIAMMSDICQFQKQLESFVQEMDLKSFADELYPIVENINSRGLLKSGARNEALEKALLDIFDFVLFRMGNVKWIKEFRHMIHGKKAKSYTFVKNVYTLKPDFAKQLPLKISLLKSVLKNHDLENLSSKKLQACEKDLELQTLVEMLVLDILSVIEGLPKQLTHINFYLDSCFPTAYGRNLRNHIAHGNALVDMLLGRNFANILLNAQKIIEVKDILQEKLGKKVENDPLKSRRYHDMDVSIMKKQKQFFVSLTEVIDEKRVKDFMNEGVDIHGRDLNSCTALHFAARAPNSEMLKFLLMFNLDINAKDDSHQTALHAAADSGRERIVEYLIEEMKMPVDSQDINGRTSMHIASMKGHEGVVRMLLRHKANTILKDIFGHAALHYAVMENHYDISNLLLENETDVDANRTYYGFTALHLAAAKGHLNLVDNLLKKEAKVNSKSDMDFVPLHYAACGGHYEIAKSLLNKGADANARTVQGLTPLHLAVDNGDVETIALLLQHGAEVDAMYLHGFTPLHFAAGYGRLAASKLLMQAGAIASLRTGDGSTPLDIAAECGHCELVEELLNGADISSKIQALRTAAFKGNLKLVELIFNSGMDIKFLHDSSALHLAAEEGHVDTVKFLLLKGADINSQDCNGDTALHLSSPKGHKEVVHLLIQMKADILIKNKSGTFPLEIIIKTGMTNFLIKEEVVFDFSYGNDISPFHYGAFYGDVDFVNYCIQKGCYVDIRTESGSTALHMATLGGRAEVIKFLLDKGSDINALDQKGCTALKHAVNSNNRKVFELLIKSGAILIDAQERSLFLSAVTQGHEDIVDYFLSKNPDVVAADPQNGDYPLHTAVYFGHVTIVKKLLEKCNKDELNILDKNFHPPLLIATEKDHCEIAQLLLSKGADPGVSSKFGDFPLLQAVTKGNFKMVEILLKPGADYLNKDTKVKNSVLHIAAASGSLEIIESLIDKKVDINFRDSSGATPIHMAAKEGHRNVLEYFLNLGMDVDERGENGWTSLHYAASGNHSKICRFLFEKGANVNAVSKDGATPLHTAAEMGKLDALLALLEIGAFYDAKDENKKTPLKVAKWWDIRLRVSLMFATNMFSAVQSNNPSTLESILMAGLDVLKFNFVNVKNAKNTASIHYAAWKGLKRIISILLRYKANPNSLTKNGWTSLHYASQFSHYEIVKELLCHGAIFEALSDSGKTPLHYSTDQNIVAILEFLEKIFYKIKNNDRSCLQELKAIENMDIVKAVVRAKNLEGRTLTSVAIANNHPNISELKEIFQTDVSVSLKMAEMFYKQGNYEESFNFYQKVLQKRMSIFDQDDPAVLEIQKQLASLLVHKGEYQEALILAKEACETLENILGDKNKEAFKAKCLFASILERAGREQQAIKVYEEISEQQREVLGLNHRDTLETLTDIAKLLYKENEFEKALKEYEQIFKSLTENYEISPWTLRIQTNIARILRKQEKFSEALELFRNIFQAKEKIFGIHNQETLETSTEIAVTLLCMGQEEESLKVLRKNLELQFNLLGANHPDTLQTRYYIADILYSERKFSEVLDIYEKDLNSRILSLGANHPSIEETEKRIDIINSLIKNPVL